ncbi:MAG TPA: hypothetical protein VIK55_02660 [Paludibacter sp.]
MKKLMTFSKNFLLANGVIWLLSGLSILLFNLNFQKQEIVISLLLPLAYAITRLFEEKKEK